MKAGNVWQEKRNTFQKEAEQIVEKLSLREMVSLMSGNTTIEQVRAAIQKRTQTHYNETPYQAGGLAEYGIPPMLFVDGSRGVVCGKDVFTCFPVAVMRAASFNPELERRIGEAIGQEVIMAGGNLFGGVCVNVPYHPRWGRYQETYGEDVTLLSAMGAAMVQGVQSTGVIATVKHFAFNSIENTRLHVDISCDKQTEAEIFLPQFRACVEAGAGAVMTSYNRYNGIRCGHHEYLLNEVLRNKWNFDGFVFSDFTWGISDTVAAANAGNDIEMPHTKYYGENLITAVKEGLVDESKIKESATRIIRTLLAHTYYIEQYKKKHALGNDLFKTHQRLALECARDSITLLKNDNEILPLSCNRPGKKIAVLGVAADQALTGDRGSSEVHSPYVVTPLAGIVKKRDSAEVIYYVGDNEKHCKRIAKEADAVIIVVGNNYYDEGEHVLADEDSIHIKDYGGDRINRLGIKDSEKRMIDAVSEIRKDAVLVLVGGSPIFLEEYDQKVGAVLYDYYSGMEGGTALGEVLFGKVNPSGKLPFAIPKRAEDCPPVDFGALSQQYDYYHGYTYLDMKGLDADYSFGYGLSYTWFHWETVKVSIEQQNDDSMVMVEIIIENKGRRDGAEVLQLYVGKKDTNIRRPKKALKGFQKIFLHSGERATVVLSCKLKALSYYDEKTDSLQIESGIYQLYVGTSHDDAILCGEINQAETIYRKDQALS